MPPFGNELGQRVQASVCSVCWGEWLKHQTALINHYALNVLDPKAKTFLYEQLEEYFFGPPTP
jgi:Fe-S cluster biosynthesis and repair protein YggX